MNMFLALAWLLLGITVLAWQILTGDDVGYLTLRDFRISYGWLMFLAVLYNLKRWRDVRAVRIRNRQRQTEMAEQQRNVKRVEQEAPNPEFNFTDNPSLPAADVTDRPAASG
jgi:hypothetical protein